MSVYLPVHDFESATCERVTRGLGLAIAMNENCAASGDASCGGCELIRGYPNQRRNRIERGDSLGRQWKRNSLLPTRALSSAAVLEFHLV
jgi:hypothetical protein